MATKPVRKSASDKLEPSMVPDDAATEESTTFPLADWASDVLYAEAVAITAIARDLPAGFTRAIAAVANARLPVICCGVGKSGLVASKIAATMASLGTPAYALPAGDAAHGDLGAVMDGSVVLLLSNSGSTTEIMRLVPALKARDCHLIGMVGQAHAPLAKLVDTLLALPVQREADHLNLAPTASTTLQMAVGDAIAVAASRLRGFTRADFLRCHPAGQLGQLGLDVSTLMRTGVALPAVLPHTALAETLAAMTSGRMGAVCVVDWEGRLIGLIVDGDIRRIIQNRGDLYSLTAASAMHARPVTLRPDASVAQALDTMRAGPGLLVLPVTDDAGQLLGMVHSVDLVQSA